MSDDSNPSKKTPVQPLFWALVAAFVLLAGLVLDPFLPALAWAVALSVLIYPIYQRMQNRWGANWAAAVSVFGALGLVVVPLTVIGLLGYSQAAEFVSELNAGATTTTQTGEGVDQYVRALDGWLQPFAAQLNLKFSLFDWFTKNKETLGNDVAKVLPMALKQIATGVLTFVVALLTMFFMLRDGHRLRAPVIELIPLPNHVADELLTRMQKTIQAVFYSVVFVGILQGGLATLLYIATGVSQPLVFGMITTALCVIPLLGGPVMYVPLGFLLLSQGKVGQAAALWIVGFGLISNVDNILRPIIVSQRVPIHPIAIFFSLLGGILFWGPVGLFLGPLLLSVLLCIQDVLREMQRAPEAA